MESTEMRRTQTASQTDDIDDGSNAKEDDPCLPVPTVSTNNTITRRKSLESLNKNRDQDGNNTSVLESEKNKNVDNTNNYKIQPTSTAATTTTTTTNTNTKKIRTVTFNPPTSKFEQWCSEKTGLSRLGLLTMAILLLILFILFIIVLVLSSLWPGVPHSALFPICRTPACLLASSEIISKMNQSVPACEDIRDYSCGHWLNTHTIPGHESIWGIKKHMQLKHREHLRNMIMTMKLPENVESVEWKIKNTYDSCMSLGTIETEGKLPLSKHISQLGGWHVMKEFYANVWDMKKTLKYLHAKYDVHPFFNIDVIPDPRVPAQSIVQISPGKLGLPDKSYYYRSSSDKIIIAYKRFLKDIAISFGATSDYANTFSEDMFGFERRLTERFPSNLHVDGNKAHHRTTLGDLQNIAPSINLYDIISFMFTNIKFTLKTEVVVVAPDYLVNVSQIFSTTDRIVLNNYMMLKLALDYMPYLSNSFRTTLHEFHKHLYGVKETTPRWETCIHTLQKYMGHGLEAISENSNGEGEKKKKVAADLFEHIRLTLRNNVMNSNNLPSHIKEHFLEKLDHMTVQIGLKVEMKRPIVYNEYYLPLTSIKDDFFMNVFLSVSFKLEERVKRLGQHNEDARWVEGISDGSLRVIYVPELNKVAIPMALLAMPYFNTHYPLSILYGSLGIEIGDAIMSGLIGEGLFYSGDGMQLSDDHPVHTKKSQCLMEEQASASTRHLHAVTATYKTLKGVLAEIPHVHQPALEYLENEALYFIAYAQSLCTMKTAERQDLDITTSQSKMDDINLLDILMHRSKEFATTFSCNRKLKKDSCDALI